MLKFLKVEPKGLFPICLLFSGLNLLSIWKKEIGLFLKSVIILELSSLLTELSEL